MQLLRILVKHICKILAHVKELQKRNLKLFQGLEDNGKIIYDGDEPLLRPFVEKAPSIKLKSFGVEENNDLRIAEVNLRNKVVLSV